MRGFIGWGFVGRDLASPGVSPVDAAQLAGWGVTACLAAATCPEEPSAGGTLCTAQQHLS